MAKNKSYWGEKSKDLEQYGNVQQNVALVGKSKLFFWRNKVVSSNKAKTIKKTKWVIIIFSLLALGLLILGLQEFTPGFSSRGLKVISKNISKIFTFKNHSSLFGRHDLWAVSLKAILETIKITFVGTIFGVILAIPTSFLSARNITKSKWINTPVRLIMTFFRTLPPLVFAMIFAVGFSPMLAATLTLMFFTWATMNKLMYEEIENTSLDAYHTLISSGTSKVVAFRQTVFKSISPKLTSLSLYSFEINLRISAILGVIGGLGGIGWVLNHFTQTSMENLGVPLMVLLGTMIAIELFSTLIRVFIFEKKAKIIDGEALDAFTTERQYHIDFLINKYEKKIARANVEKKIKLELIKEKKINKINVKYASIEPNLVNKVKKEDVAKIKSKYNAKREKISNTYSIKINKAKLKNKKDKVFKLEIALKKLIFNIDIQEKKELETIHAALNSAQKVLFVEKRRPNFWVYTLLLSIFIIGMFIWSIIGAQWHIESTTALTNSISYIFKPTTDLLFGQAMRETMNATLIAFVATIIGGVAAFFVGMLASRKVTPIYISPFFQLLTMAIRVVPAFVIAILFVPGLVDPKMAALIALGFHSIGMLGKMVKEQFDAMDTGPGTAIKSAGGSNIDVLRYATLPQVMPHIMSVTIYRFEINIKSMVEVGVIITGISPMGWHMAENFNLARGGNIQALSDAYAYVWSIIIIVIIVEFFSNIIRGYLLTGMLPKWMHRINKFVLRRNNIRKAIFLKGINYNLQEMSDQEIWLSHHLEKQAAIDYGYLKLLKDKKEYKRLIQVNEELFFVKNQLQFKDLVETDRDSFELRKNELKAEYKTLKSILKESIKEEKVKYKAANKKYADRSKKVSKDIRNEYRTVVSKYNDYLKETKLKYKGNIKVVNDKLQEAKQKGYEPDVVLWKMEKIKAKKQYTYNVKMARKTPINDFI